MSDMMQTRVEPSSEDAFGVQAGAPPAIEFPAEPLVEQSEQAGVQADDPLAILESFLTRKEQELQTANAELDKARGVIATANANAERALLNVARANAAINALNGAEIPPAAPDPATPLPAQQRHAADSVAGILAAALPAKPEWQLDELNAIVLEKKPTTSRTAVSAALTTLKREQVVAPGHASGFWRYLGQQQN